MTAEPTDAPDRLHALYDVHGQSPWLDNLKRGYITSGRLAELRDDGVRGLTSNPSIFQKAIQGSDDYDDQFADLVGRESSVVDDYWELVIRDIHGACDVFAPVHEASAGVDGFVSVEVDPGLAHDGPGTESAARDLHERLRRRNLMVKIPATEAGLPDGGGRNRDHLVGVVDLLAVARHDPPQRTGHVPAHTGMVSPVLIHCVVRHKGLVATEVAVL